MKDNILIKKFPNGIRLHLNPDLDFEDLIKEIAAKFNQSRHFFRDARVALAFEGRELTDDEERQIITTIQLNSDIEILCIIGKNEETDRNFVKAIQKILLVPYVPPFVLLKPVSHIKLFFEVKRFKVK